MDTIATNSRTERASDIWRKRDHPLDAMLAPNSVALIGATETEGSVGRTLMKNLSGFEGAVYPINPKRSSVLGVQAYPNIAAVPDKIDLAVIVTPATTVPGLIRDCAQVGVPAAVIISAGFKEVGPAGALLEQQILAEAQRSQMRILGPNCLGVMRPHGGLNATFAADMALPGSVGF